MCRPFAWALSGLIHITSALCLVVCSKVGVRPAGPAASVKEFPYTSSVSLDFNRPAAIPEFDTAKEMRLELIPEEVDPIEYQREVRPLNQDIETTLGQPLQSRSEPVFERRLSFSALTAKLPFPDSLPDAETETLAREANNIPPEYPPAARRQRLEGTVVVDVTVLPDGTCGNVAVVEDGGLFIFREAVLNAVKKWNFTPATRRGKPVASILRLRFVFKIES